MVLVAAFTVITPLLVMVILPMPVLIPASASKAAPLAVNVPPPVFTVPPIRIPPDGWIAAFPPLVVTFRRHSM